MASTIDIQGKLNSIESKVREVMMAKKIAELKIEYLASIITEIEMHGETISTAYIVNKLKKITE